MRLKHNRILARHLTHRENHIGGHRERKKSTELMSILLIFLILLGVATTIYALIKKDFNLALLGLGIILYSLLAVSIIVKAKRRREAHESIRHIKIYVKEVKVHADKNDKHQGIMFGQLGHLILRLILRLKKSKYQVAFFLFLLFGLAAGLYFWYVEEDTILLGISALITLIALVSIARSIKKGKEGRGLSQPSKEKPKEKQTESEKSPGESAKGEKEKKGEREGGKEEVIESIKSSEIEKLKKNVKEKMDSLDKGKTPLDILYWLLGEKKQLKLQDISKIFLIDIKKAEEWAKILEAHELAEMNYPAFGPPALRIKKILPLS